ncbi:hypothetical protein DSC45_28390 [Streptomyces sp. YIM 130001]|nr:hypothetical protein DSC45_28390 [Streptomyces sp. YIM 130001]
MVAGHGIAPASLPCPCRFRQPRETPLTGSARLWPVEVVDLGREGCGSRARLEGPVQGRGSLPVSPPASVVDRGCADAVVGPCSWLRGSVAVGTPAVSTYRGVVRTAYVVRTASVMRAAHAARTAYALVCGVRACVGRTCRVRHTHRVRHTRRVSHTCSFTACALCTPYAPCTPYTPNDAGVLCAACCIRAAYLIRPAAPRTSSAPHPTPPRSSFAPSLARRRTKTGRRRDRCARNVPSVR